MAAISRKYRPQTFAAMVGQNHIKLTLQNELAGNSFVQAYLFCGPRGLGKTTAARLFAKAVNCQQRTAGHSEPCNKCESCLAINQGKAMDIIEIDAASHTGVDNVRENIIENVRFAPSHSQYKVFIIDEIHMLSISAFNALLKTLEEPPEHVLFILCTTEADKLPATIISRCLQLNFSWPKEGEIIRALKRIIKGEKLEVGNGVLKEIGRHSNHSFRDAVKILEQLSFQGKKINLNQVKSFFGNGEEFSKSILRYLADKNIKQALLWLNWQVRNGVDLKILTTAILEALRKFLLKKYMVLNEEIDDYGLNTSQIEQLITLFDKASRELKGAFISQLPLELAIIKFAEKGESNIIKKNSKLILIPAKDKWNELLLKIKSENKQLEALLKSSQPEKVGKDILTVQVFYKFHKGKLELAENIKLVENKLKEVYQKPLKVKYILKTKGGRNV